MSLAKPQAAVPQETPRDASDWRLDALHAADKELAKRAFLRMASHELRTPLNSIIGFAEVLSQELYGPLGAPQYREYAGIIRDSGTKLLNLFNNFLEVVRLENGGDFRVGPEAVLPSLENARAKVRAAAAARGVAVMIRLTDDNLHAMFDPRGLASCLDQLLCNAIDFTAPGGTVELNARRAHDQGEVVEVSVFNRGDAPDPADIERLMRPFEQGSKELNRTHEGAGLGWAIVRLTAQAMGGGFAVATRKGEALKAIVRLQAAE